MPLLPRVERGHLPAQALESAPRHRVPPAPAASRREPPRRSQGPPNAASTTTQPTPVLPQRQTRLATLRANLADREEQHAACRARRLQRTPPPQTTQLEGPAMRTRSKTSLHNTIPQQDTKLEEAPTGPAMHTRSKTQEAMLSCCEVRQKTMSANTLMSRHFPKEVLAAVLNEETCELMEYRQLIGNPKYRTLWQRSYGDEIGRLTQGMPGRFEGTDTIFFIKKKDVPAHRWRDITYGRIVVSFRPAKDDPNRTRLTMGGTASSIQATAAQPPSNRSPSSFIKIALSPPRTPDT